MFSSRDGKHLQAVEKNREITRRIVIIDADFVSHDNFAFISFLVTCQDGLDGINLQGKKIEKKIGIITVFFTIDESTKRRERRIITKREEHSLKKKLLNKISAIDSLKFWKLF